MCLKPPAPPKMDILPSPPPTPEAPPKSPLMSDKPMSGSSARKGRSSLRINLNPAVSGSSLLIK